MKAYPDFGLVIKMRQYITKKVAYKCRFVVSCRVECYQGNTTDVLEKNQLDLLFLFELPIE